MQINDFNTMENQKKKTLFREVVTVIDSWVDSIAVSQLFLLSHQIWLAGRLLLKSSSHI